MTLSQPLDIPTVPFGVSQNYGYHFGGPNNKDENILGSILGSPYFGKLQNLNMKIRTGA